MGIKGGVRAEMGAFVQDRWTVNRLTVNAGLRFDYNHTGWDEYHFGPGPLVPNRNFTVEEEDFYKFKDLSPRVGAAYDIFGNGRTALKANIGKYGLALDPTQGVPARDRIVPRVTRSWTDADRDFTPDCDLINPLAQSPATTGSIDTCGQISDLRFGTEIPRATTYDPADSHRLERPAEQLGVLDQRAARGGHGPRRRCRLLPPVVQELHRLAEPCRDAGRLHHLQHPRAGGSAAAQQRPDAGRPPRRQSEQVRPGRHLRDGGRQLRRP